MAYKNGWAMGKEGRLRGKDIILGPAINIQRLPVGGRTYEYLSEDPVLSAILSVEYTKGSQEAGTAVCLKHFALNNQETDRGSVDVIVDERTMREIYLKPFEAAVKEGGAMCVMPAYNKVNGFYCSENNHLLNEILRDEWGFRGMTVSDWGGTHSTMGAALGGLCVQMTGDNYFGQALIDSVRNGALDESVVDNKVREILRLRFAIEPVPEDVANTVMTSQPETQKVAYEIAQKSIVLLKNEGTLPIAKEVKKIAVIGQNAVLTTAAGGIGAGVKTLYEITPLEGIQARAAEAGVEVVYAPGYKNYAMRMGWGRRRPGADAPVDPLVANSIDEPADPALLAEAVALAKDADMVIFFGGTNKSIETEGSDRKNIDLPCGQNEVIQALYEANPNLATVLISGGPTDIRVLEQYSPAIVQGWWNGLEGGTALAEVLFGDIAPSGKLPFTFPLKLEDSPAYAMGNFGQKASEDLFTLMYRLDATGYTREQINEYIANLPKPESHYTEGILVGYRWFDTKKAPVMYAFGHGLSYVDFEYGDLSLKQKKDKIQVSFTLKNLGDMEADEVAQLYVRRPETKIERADKQLEAFERVTLKAGETKTVTLEFPISELAHWDMETNGWVVEPGKVEILVGTSSDNILKTIETTI
jgi:beta-glucosidase